MKAGTQRIMDSLEEQGAFFGVVEEGVKTASGRVIEGKKAIVHEDGTPLGIVAKSYRTIHQRETFEKFAAALDRSSLDLNGVDVSAIFANGGARTMVFLDFPNHTIEPKVGDITQLRITIKNSYDGRWKFSTLGGGLRLNCLNGMTSQMSIAGYAEYHNSKLDVDHAAEKVVSILGKFEGLQSLWQKMLKAQISDDKAWRVICLYADRQADFKRGLCALREATRANTATKMFEQYEKVEKKELGPNAFGVFNTLTHHATHANLREGKGAISLDLRQARVQEVLASKYWNDRVIGSKTH